MSLVPHRTGWDEAALLDAMVGYQAAAPGAFERLYDAMAPALRRYHLAQARDSARADDLVQETFLQIHRSRHTFSPHQPVLPWVFAIARHVVLMDRRKIARRRRREVESSDGIPEPAVPPAFAGAGDRDADRYAIGQALAELPADRREALVLHHVDGLGFKDVARRLGITEGAAKLRSSRGMGMLRRLLKRNRVTDGGDGG